MYQFRVKICCLQYPIQKSVIEDPRKALDEAEEIARAEYAKHVVRSEPYVLSGKDKKMMMKKMRAYRDACSRQALLDDAAFFCVQEQPYRDPTKNAVTPDATIALYCDVALSKLSIAEHHVGVKKKQQDHSASSKKPSAVVESIKTKPIECEEDVLFEVIRKQGQLKRFECTLVGFFDHNDHFIRPVDQAVIDEQRIRKEKRIQAREDEKKRTPNFWPPYRVGRGGQQKSRELVKFEQENQMREFKLIDAFAFGFPKDGVQKPKIINDRERIRNEFKTWTNCGRWNNVKQEVILKKKKPQQQQNLMKGTANTKLSSEGDTTEQLLIPL
jgi:hypothetical protein